MPYTLKDLWEIKDIELFEDRWLTEKFVYFLIKDENVIYVGKSSNVLSRLSAHHKAKKPDKIAVKVVPDDTPLDIVESFYIQKFNPPLNKAKGDEPDAGTYSTEAEAIHWLKNLWEKDFKGEWKRYKEIKLKEAPLKDEWEESPLPLPSNWVKREKQKQPTNHPSWSLGHLSCVGKLKAGFHKVGIKHVDIENQGDYEKYVFHLHSIEPNAIGKITFSTSISNNGEFKPSTNLGKLAQATGADLSSIRSPDDLVGGELAVDIIDHSGYRGVVNVYNIHTDPIQRYRIYRVNPHVIEYHEGHITPCPHHPLRAKGI